MDELEFDINPKLTQSQQNVKYNKINDKQNGFDELTHYVDQVFENINENLSVIKLAHTRNNLQIPQNTLINKNEDIDIHNI